MQRGLLMRTYSIRWTKGKCVDLTDGLLTNGNQVQLWDCGYDSNNNNQVWDAGYLYVHPPS